jgi:hypothetical protein
MKIYTRYESQVRFIINKTYNQEIEIYSSLGFLI